MLYDAWGVVSADMCEQIAKIRRKLQRVGINHILFLDETHKREGDVENYTITLPGEPSFITTSSTSNYADRYDMQSTRILSFSSSIEQPFTMSRRS
jgi:hypothetical protein